VKLKLFTHKRFPWALVTVLFLGLAATFLVKPACAEPPNGITSIFKPLSTPAEAIHEISLLVLGICAAIFLLIGSLLTYTIIRFRQRPGDDDREPPQVYGSNQIELAWTVTPILIVFVLNLMPATPGG